MYKGTMRLSLKIRPAEVLLLLFLLSCAIFAAEETSEEEYLYHTDEAAPFIIDYEPDGTDKPDFIYGAKQGPRVVEFYAPWCPHCQNFRSHYINFAEQVRMILKEYRGPPVQFYAVSCTANRNLCRAHQIDGYPRIFLFAENAAVNATADVTYWKLHAFDVLDKLGVQVPQLRLDVSETNSEAALGISQTEAKVPVTGAFNSIAAFNRLRFRNPKGTIVPDVHNQRTKQQVFDDAYRSFDFNLRNGIFLKEGPLTNATQMALRDWLDLVKQTTPVVWQTHTVINAILADFDQAVRSEENLIKIIDRFPPPSPKWSLACTKGVVGMGYTCGLWQLFHIISVGVVEYNLMIPAADDTVLVELTLPTTHAAETLRNFVEHFFGCDVCRLNFLKAYDSCAFDRCNRLTANEMNGDQWILFPIWLFETHNAVNARLFREKADRENRLATPAEEVATQWPAKNVCPKCWLDSGGWDEESVYKYLRTEYWTEDYISAGFREEVRSLEKNSTNDKLDKPPLMMQLIPLGLIAGLAATWYAKRVKRIKSGLHKKRDEEC